MEMQDLGEFGLIDRIERAASKQSGHRSVVLGIGDDAAVLRPRSGEDVVVTTDALVETVHFRWETQSARAIGRRSLVASLSDLAAMGARPMGFVVALAAPPRLAIERFDGLVAGLLREAQAHACPLVGGNLARARQTSISVTAIGAVDRGKALTRGRARSGDRIFVTGTLGGVALEVALAARGLGLVRRIPVPRLRAGRALARVAGVGAVIDISDGLLADAEHLLAGTGCHAQIDRLAVPLPAKFAGRCAEHGLDPVALATGGGEDYELLFTVRANGPTRARIAGNLGCRVTEIGSVVRGGAKASDAAGWRHF
ncbi:MAG: thiamine-phosphate kinase [Myxococcota bacterium]